MPEIKPPYRHQMRAVVKAVKSFDNGCGLYVAHRPGAGKTRTGIMTAQAVRAKRILVLCPKIARGVWQDQIRLYWPGHLGRFYITNYDRLTTVVRRKRANGKPYKEHRGKALEKRLIAWKPYLVILDEGHYAKAPHSQRTKSVHRIVQALPHSRVLLLSGTPSHSPLDWWAQYRMIAPKHPMWRQNFSAYRSQVAVMGGPTGNWVTGFDVDGLAEALEATRRYTDVVDKLNLPDPVEQTVPLTLSPAEKAVYEKMKHDLFVELSDDSVSEATTVLTKLLRLQQITSGFLRDTDRVDHPTGRTKIAALVELLGMGKWSKVVVSCNFLYDVDVVEAACGKVLGEPMVITGDTSETRRNEIVRKFRDAEKALVVMHPKAGGISVDFSSADALVRYSLNPSTIVEEQLVSRCWRPPRTTPLQVVTLICRNTVDGIMDDALKNKMKTTGLIRMLKRHLRGGEHGS